MLRGGGLIVADVTQTPMKVVATLEAEEVHPAGCGGVQVGNAMYINSGGGRSGKFVGVARVSNMKEGKETADPHGIAARK